MAALTVMKRPASAIRLIKGPNGFIKVDTLLPSGIQIAKWRASDGLLMDVQIVGEGTRYRYVPMRCYDRRYIYTYITPDPMSVLPSGEAVYTPYPDYSDLVPGVSKITERYLNDPLLL